MSQDRNKTEETEAWRDWPNRKGWPESKNESQPESPESNEAREDDWWRGERDEKLQRELEWLEKEIKASADVALPEDGHYYDSLEDKIMSALEQKLADDGHKKVRENALRPSRPARVRAAQAMLFSAFALMMSAKFLLSAKDIAISGQDVERGTDVVQTTRDAAKQVLVATMMTHHQPDDLVMEMAARRLASLELDEVKARLAR